MSVAELLFSGKNKNKPVNVNTSGFMKNKSLHDDEEETTGSHRRHEKSMDGLNKVLGKSSKLSGQKSSGINRNNFGVNAKRAVNKGIDDKGIRNGSSNGPVNRPQVSSANIKARKNEKLIENITNTNKPNKLNKKEEMLLKTVKGFTNLNDLFEEIEKNKDFSKIWSSKKKEEIEKEKARKEEMKVSNIKYKPTTTNEAKILNKIEEANKIKAIEDIKLMGKKRKNEYSLPKKPGIVNKQQKSVYTNPEDEVWCAKCRKMHDINLHKKPLQVDISKIFGSSNKVPVNNNNMSNIRNKTANKPMSASTSKPGSSTYKEPKSMPRERDNRERTNTNHIAKIRQGMNLPSKSSSNASTQLKRPPPQPIKKQIHTSRPNRSSDSYYRQEDFEEEDDFIVSDDEEADNYRRYMSRITRNFRRGGYYSDEYSDEDLEEAGFDEIQAEEDRTAKIGEHEDWIEEMREKQLMEKKQRRSSY